MSVNTRDWYRVKSISICLGLYPSATVLQLILNKDKCFTACVYLSVAFYSRCNHFRVQMWHLLSCCLIISDNKNTWHESTKGKGWNEVSKDSLQSDSFPHFVYEKLGSTFGVCVLEVQSGRNFLIKYWAGTDLCIYNTLLFKSKNIDSRKPWSITENMNVHILYNNIICAWRRLADSNTTENMHMPVLYYNIDCTRGSRLQIGHQGNWINLEMFNWGLRNKSHHDQ